MNIWLLISVVGTILCVLSFYTCAKCRKGLERQGGENSLKKEVTPALDKSEYFCGGFRPINETRVYYKVSYFGIFLWIDTDKCYRLVLNDQSYSTTLFFHKIIGYTYYGTEKPNKKEIFIMYWEHYSIIFLFIFCLSLFISVIEQFLPDKKAEGIDAMIERYKNIK